MGREGCYISVTPVLECPDTVTVIEEPGSVALVFARGR